MKSQKNLNSKDSTTKPSIGYRVYQISRGIVGISFLFWVLYTIAFQFIDGLHWSAISPTEKFLDDTIGTIWFVFVFIMFTIWCFKLDRIMDESKCC
jgi:hypothetical protein